MGEWGSEIRHFPRAQFVNGPKVKSLPTNVSVAFTITIQITTIARTVQNKRLKLCRIRSCNPTLVNNCYLRLERINKLDFRLIRTDVQLSVLNEVLAI